jgi:hypothetical protein
MPADDQREKFFQELARAYLDLTREIVLILESTLDDIQVRSKGDEPVTDADQAVIKVISKISEALTNARKKTEGLG